MNILERAPVLDDILENWRTALGADYAAYRNHCYRVLNFTLAFCEAAPENIQKVSIAAAFHDLGIWANDTYDYLGPSRLLALDHLAQANLSAWDDEIAAMIEQHHKLSRYKKNPDWLVEPFRKADWIDVSRGRLKFGLGAGFVAEVLTTFPNARFHKRLVALTKQRFRTHPLSPLPMMRL